MSHAIAKIQRGALAALDFFLPSLCISCDQRVHPRALAYAFICSDCEKKIERIDLPVCAVCGAPHRASISGKYCKDCPPRPHHFDLARGVVVYNDVSAEMVKTLKYQRLTSIADWMANMMFLNAEDYLPFSPDVVTALPLHFTRRAGRGFNQADLIARRLCRLKEWPYEPGALVRVRPTPKQSLVSRRERERNVREAFLVGEEGLVRDRNVMIVDDVFTTGSSANECARVLKKAGARRVIIFTFARAA